jgi:adenylate cyclase
MTLPRFFALILGALALLAGLVLTLAVRTAGQAVIRTGEAARIARATQVATAIEADLSVAERAVEDFEQALANHIVDDRDPMSERRYLAAELIAQRNLTDLTLTSGELTGYGDDGEAVLTPVGRRQASAFRDSAGRIQQRLVDHVVPDGKSDPTLHDTFRAAANRDARGRALWSDLSFTELDAALPLDLRRKVMTVQKAIFASNGTSAAHFVGVLRAGLVSDTLDRVGTSAAAGDPHQIFICDAAGRLVTRLSLRDAHILVDQVGRPDPDGDLRVVPATAPPASVAAALAFAREGGMGGKRMVVSGSPYLLTLLPVAEGRAQQWLVGVVVPESYYVGALAASRDRLLVLLALVVLGIAFMGAFGARTVGRGVGALVASTEAMRRFSFEPASGPVSSPFAEIRSALESVERAKTALRAMVKYVPVDLVRRLYESGRDPVLAAEAMEVSLMFTDIADFTTHAESLAPDQLAQALGRYLEVATNAVEQAGGTVDKYIGDALMVLWNAPEPLADHPVAACRAALACAAATRDLGASDWWRSAGLPPWRTRFGLHTDRVLVGNFGAPDRMSYTAMGDGVNLAARLEGLNKVYGTTILVSDEVRRRAGDGFVFRRIDRVAVKGKTHPVDVHELVGHAGDREIEARRPAIALHEQALAAAFEGLFTDALALLRDVDVSDDGATKLLAARCRAWIVDPPPAGWDGTWAATTK